MTLSVSTQASPVGAKLIVQTDADETANNDVTGTSGSIYMIEIDNEGNADNAAYLKLYDNASPTIGTTSPDWVFKVAVNQKRSIVVPSGLDFTNLSFACVISGGTAGTTGPTSAVIVKIVTT